ncbi:uncharacterized protein TNCT_710232 [Trichonephila clavata]|uniref:Uncharacterized protein n=1 Tax=Trichonephila clavata TaxID=2740835 RepID=A0A8X6FHJ0_TRICU|nr:uncharacterized protein TNCT_710232 [Trichonephila clavata]
MERMKILEQNAREQWESTTRHNASELSQKTEPEEIIAKTVLFTWLPWFETTTPEEGQKDTSTKTGQLSKFRQAIGVGSWREITLYGKRKTPITNEIPETSALCVNSASVTASLISTFIITFVCFVPYLKYTDL